VLAWQEFPTLYSTKLRGNRVPCRSWSRRRTWLRSELSFLLHVSLIELRLTFEYIRYRSKQIRTVFRAAFEDEDEEEVDASKSERKEAALNAARSILFSAAG